MLQGIHQNFGAPLHRKKLCARICERSAQATQQAYFWSCSRNKLWRKGESSGNTLSVKEIMIDCDGDTLLLMVDPAGPAFHTGNETCFYRKVEVDNVG